MSEQQEDRRLAENVRRARAEVGMSQAALAEEMQRRGHSTWRQTTVSRLESTGRRLLEGEALSLIAVLGPQVLDGSPARDFLLAGADERFATQVMRGDAGQLVRTLADTILALRHISQNVRDDVDTLDRRLEDAWLAVFVLARKLDVDLGVTDGEPGEEA